MDIRCSREGIKCDGCPIMEECEKAELTDEVDFFKIYNQALEDVDNIIAEQLDKSDNQVECQTLRWVLDVLSDLIK